MVICMYSTGISEIGLLCMKPAQHMQAKGLAFLDGQYSQSIVSILLRTSMNVICLALFNVILIVFIITYLWSQMSNAISTTKLLNNCWFEALRQKNCQHCHCQSNC